jgi:YYY domain-containing protein
MDSSKQTNQKSSQVALEKTITLVLLIAVLLVGFLLRSYNLKWDMGTHLHPDERFLSMVETSIQPVKSLSEYFNTETSSLNPHNQGYGFFVYGTLPVFIIRYIGEITQQTGYDSITLLGRQLSVQTELVSILLIFMIGRKLGNDWLGLGAAAFYALSVVPIQQAHFMTVDTFTNTFGLLTVYAGVLIQMQPPNSAERRLRSRELWLFVFFGLALGMAAASKANAVTIALLLPLIVYVRYLKAQSQGVETNTFLRSFGLMALAGIVSFVTFRILQPYAFSGPSFLNFNLNPKWLANMQELSAAAKGVSDSPPALQWARRSILFGPYNLAVWGMGIPFAVLALLGLVGQLYTEIKKKWFHYLPIILWTLFYFLWQSISWTSAMRYYLLIYPLLAISAAWACIKLFTIRNGASFGRIRLNSKVWPWVGRIIALVALLGTAAWAFAFTRIYSRDFTRVSTSEWIYQNLPGALTFTNKTSAGNEKMPVSFPAEAVVNGNDPFYVVYRSALNANLDSLTLPNVLDEANKNKYSLYTLEAFVIMDGRKSLGPPVKAQLSTENKNNPSRLLFKLPLYTLRDGETYLFEIRAVAPQSVTHFQGEPLLSFLRSDGSFRTVSLLRVSAMITPGASRRLTFTVPNPGQITELEIPHLFDFSQAAGVKQLQFRLSIANNPEKVSTGTLASDFLSIESGTGAGYKVAFKNPLTAPAQQELILEITLTGGQGAIGVNAPVNLLETSWDDALPVSRPGFIPYGDTYGAYQGKNLELYWAEDQNKVDRMIDLINSSDYILMSSNRVWGTTVRVPERYPLATLFYQELMGCPQGSDIVRCYNDVEMGSYLGRLGFDLVNVGTSYPNLGNLRFNDQYAEEAFSVYDHPKTLVFRKNNNFDIDKVKALLAQVDLSKVVSITAKQADTYKPTTSPQSQFQLTPEEIKTQTEGGTWSDLFDRKSPLNTSPFLGAAALYLFITLFGWLIFPFTRLALGGLQDKGFAFTKITALLFLAYAVFIAGNYGGHATKTTILLVTLLVMVINLIIAFLTRKGLQKDLRLLWKQFLLIEVLGLLAFAFFLFVRYQNPDLWHPWKGGEKPMDFSFFNAVLKSTVFPAYNPWFSGDFINYYYYGFVILAMPVKLLGIIPAIAYNVILPIWYSLVFIGAYSIGWNLLKAILKQAPQFKLFGQPFWAGLWSALLLVFLGNLGAVRLFKETLEKLGSSGADLALATGFQKIAYFFSGLIKFLQKTPLPLYPGDWYWIPSRMIPGEPITEFPMFTFLYADLHAHLMVMPVAILAVAWALSFLQTRMQFGDKLKTKIGKIIAIFGLGGLVLGALKPINTWDFYTYPLLAGLIVLYTGIRYRQQVKQGYQKIISYLPAIAAAIGLLALSIVMYKPFNDLFRPGYNKVALWEGTRTPIRAYTGHWGVFLFIIAAYLLWETYYLLKTTRMSALEKFQPHLSTIISSCVLLGLAFVSLLLLKVVIAVYAFPLCVLALFLFIMEEKSDAKKLTYFIIGTALLLTIIVELIWPEGDNGRQNSVFKLYLQAWILLSLVAGPAIMLVWKAHKRWKLPFQLLFEIPLILLLAGAAFFPVMAGVDKISDRIDRTAPHTLDGMKFMQTSSYFEPGVLDPQRPQQVQAMSLGEDYDAIRWVQDNVKGSPVILEGQAYEYRWGNRFTIYTGLPGVVGWNYHQRQQHAVLADNRVQDRVDAVNEFYNTSDLEFVRDFMKKYRVAYIVVGQLEARFYPGGGLNKFPLNEGILWEKVYSSGQTSIYQVRP